MNLLVGTLFSNIVETKAHNEPLEGGYFEVQVHVNKAKIDRSGDPRGLTMHEVAVHLAQAVLDTGIPKEYWNIQFSPEFQKAFNLPATVRFDATR